MKSGFEQEDFFELLQSLDDGGEESCNDGDNHWEIELEPKHKIFLSHSGAQKNFTEQLCRDLERWDYSPFFDKRPDSLPKGKKFPELIFQAAQQCRVAILMLSEDFFTRTKWPMLELEAFVQSQNTNPGMLEILPVYLGLSRHECTRNDSMRRRHWLSVWREWAKLEDRIDVDKWMDALKVLGPSNGIEYAESSSEVALRDQIVDAVRRLIPPEISWSDAHVQGRTHICKAIIEKFVSTKPSPKHGVRIVGVYGMGGMGKTTFCKALCDELYMKFHGKVCHVELGSKSPIELQKEVLRRLTDINDDNLAFKTEEMTIDLLRRRIRQQKVFLALDNVWHESLEETKVYLNARFHYRSIVMVTARSLDILENLNINRSDCLEMPDLEKGDARKLFLHSAAPCTEFPSESDERKIQYCINQCRFHRGKNMDEHFHPLALKVLGAQLGSLGCDPSIWVESLSKDDKFNQFRDRVHPIFNVLRKSYDSLCEEDQLLFMDVVLFRPPLKRDDADDFKQFVTSDTNYDPFIFGLDTHEWLRIVHNLPEVKCIKERLQALKAKSLLEDIGDDFHGIKVHDLYREFAKLEAKRGDLNARRWVWYNNEAPFDLTKSPPGNCWSNVERIFVKYDYDTKLVDKWKGVVEGIRWQHFSNVVVLELFIGLNEGLDLRGLLCLRSIKVTWLRKHNGYKSGGQIIGLGELRNLECLHLRNIYHAACFEEIGELTMLQVLQLEMNLSLNNFSSHPKPLEPPNLDKCIQLKVLILSGQSLMSFPNLSKLTSLRKVIFERNYNAREVVGLSSQMSSLRELSIFDCSSLIQCDGLGDVVSLQKLNFVGNSEFMHLLDLHKLTNLRQLNISYTKVKEVLGLNASMLLQELFLEGVEDLSNLHLLRHLQRLYIEHVKLMILSFDNMIALEELILIDLSEVRDLYGIDKLSRLQRLTIISAPNLLQLPVLGDLIALQYLKLSNCCSFVGNAELLDLHNLTKLEVLDLCGTPIRSLPPLKHLTQLRNLFCGRTLLAELPSLEGLDKLEYIYLTNCRELTSLDKVGPLPSVLFLDVSTCYSLERLPDLRNSKSLEYLSFFHSRVHLFPEDIMTLATIPALRMVGWAHLEVHFSKLLETMSLAEVEMHVERKQSEYFATLQTQTWIDPDTFLEKSTYFRHTSHKGFYYPKRPSGMEKFQSRLARKKSLLKYNSVVMAPTVSISNHAIVWKINLTVPGIVRSAKEWNGGHSAI